MLKACAFRHGPYRKRSGDHEDIYQGKHFVVGRSRIASDGMDGFFRDGDRRRKIDASVGKHFL
jgi:hypothetical protein